MANLQRAQTRYRLQSEERARRGLLGVLDARPLAAGDDGAALLGAVEAVGRHEGIRFRAPPRRKAAEEGPPDLSEIQRVSGIRARGIRLDADDRWWLGDSGALLAWRRGAGNPVALLPGASGRYRALDLETGRAERVDARLARDISPEARFFYRPLPQDGPVRSGALLRFAFRGLGRHFACFALAGLLAGLLMLAPSVLLGVVVDSAVPSGSGRQLLELSLALALLAVLAALLLMLQGTALMRLGGPRRRPARRGALGPDARPAPALLQPLPGRRPGPARDGLPGAARPGLGRGRQRAAVGDLPVADVRPACSSTTPGSAGSAWRWAFSRSG